MKKSLSERIRMLEDLGIDMSDFKQLIIDGKVVINADSKSYAEDKQLESNKQFRRWITAQTLRMFKTPIWDRDTRRYVCSWDLYLKNYYSYMYQFDMTLEELKTLKKLEVTDKREFEIRKRFFNKSVIILLCSDYLTRFKKYCKNNKIIYGKHNGQVKLKNNYGYMTLESIANDIIRPLINLVDEINKSESYAEIYTYFKKFRRIMNDLPRDTVKCAEWKDAFKGAGAYYTLQNLVLYHDVVLEKDKKTSLKLLEDMLDGEVWKYHRLLKNWLDDNEFNLSTSIAKH